MIVKILKNAGYSGLQAVVAGFSLFASAQAAELLDVRFGPSGDTTRIVFDLSGATDYTISGDETGAGRLMVDFASLATNSGDHNFKPGKGHILRYGFAQAPQSGARAVLELKQSAKISKIFMLEPSAGVAKHRLVIDLQTADKKDFLASLPGRYPDLAAVIEQATAETSQPVLVLPPTPTQKEVRAEPLALQTIVIAAGHGGADPGAQGQSGTFEKTVTLAAALKLAEILEKRGRYKVVLTRNDDSTIRPDARETQAREANADLFIALHADAIANTVVRGASVYTLSDAGAARSATLAKAQGEYEVYDLDLEKVGQERGQDLGDILLDKAQDFTSTASSNFAEMLIDKLAKKTPMLNRSHRKGDLRVLLAPDVPAVLMEMAFISNVKDEANLNSPAWRKRAMTAVADAIDQYFDDPRLQRQAANTAGGAQ